VELNNAKLFINPVSGRNKGRKHAAEIITFLKDWGLVSEPYFSQKNGDLTYAIRQACLEGCRTVIIAGGDGSIHEAVNGIMESKKENVALGLIPIGTGNDFIKAVGIPKDHKKACEYLLSAQAHAIDIGHIETDGDHSAYFINNIGAGFDGKIGLTAQKIPLIRGIAVYILALIWHLIKGIPRPKAKIKIDEREYTSDMTLMAISNGTTYGGTFNIAPDAKFDDGKLDCVFVPARGRVSVIPMLLQLMQAKHLSNPKVLFRQCENFEIETNEPIVVIADGELMSERCQKFQIKIIKKQFNLLIK